MGKLFKHKFIVRMLAALYPVVAYYATVAVYLIVSSKIYQLCEVLAWRQL